MNGPHSEHVVLFDQTDTVKDKPIVAKDAKLFLEKIKTEVPQYSRLSIYVIKNDPEGKNIEPIISVCNPGDEKNLGMSNDMTSVKVVSTAANDGGKSGDQIMPLMAIDKICV